MRTRTARLVLWVMLLGIFAGCVPAPAPVVEARVPAAVSVDLASNLSMVDVASLWQDGEITVIDVREDFEFAAGHIPGALWIPLGELPGRVDEVPTDRPVVMVCRSGNRSAQAMQFLQKEGFTNIHNMLGGMNDWIAAGYEIEK